MIILYKFETWHFIHAAKKVQYHSTIAGVYLDFGPTARGERLLQTHTLIGQKIQQSSSCPIRARTLYLLPNQGMRQQPKNYGFIKS